MTARWTTKNRGFSLVETIVASVILSATVLVIVATSTKCISTTRLNRQYETAASLIEKQLTLIDFIGIDDFIDVGTLDGDVTELEPGYHWEVETEYQEIDSLYIVTITVSWLDRNRPYNLVVDTMFNGVSAYVETETDSADESGAGAGGGDAGGGAR